MASKMDAFIDTASRVADTAARTTGRLVNKGRDQATRVALNARLGKLYRQLGSLVYAQQKSGQADEDLVAFYVGEIDRIKQRLEKLAPPPKDNVTIFGMSGTGAEGDEDAMFRGGNGDELPRK